MRVKSRATATPFNEDHSSIVGGSTARLRRLCAKSIDEERGQPRTSSIAADTGTALHHIVEQAVNGSLTNKQIRHFIGNTIRLKSMAHDIEITEAMIEGKVLPALDYLDKIVPVHADLHIEKKLELVGYVEDGFGTTDVCFMVADTARGGIIDWKFGDWPVEAEDNDQMRFYLCIAIVNGLLPQLSEYEAHIFQPSERVSPADYAKVAVYTHDDLMLFARDLRDAIEEWREGKAVHNPGAHCNNCKGKLTCKAYQQFITTATASDVSGLSTKDLARMLDMVPGIRSFAHAIEEAALRNAQLGFEIPGWTLEPMLGSRCWKDEQAAWTALGRLGVPADVRTIKSTISAPQAIKALERSGTPAKQIDRFAQTHIIRPDRGEKLVRAKPGQETGGALSRLGTALAARGH